MNSPSSIPNGERSNSPAGSELWSDTGAKVGVEPSVSGKVSFLLSSGIRYRNLTWIDQNLIELL
jgi:hypothetical protein